MPLISIIVPVYKVELYLERCLRSILNQTLEDFELILVDDGSPDNCPKMCDEFAAEDKRIHVIHQKNRGLSAARNVGLDWMFNNSASKWVTFIDSDDWVHPQYLEVLYQSVSESNTNVSICGYYLVEQEMICEFADTAVINIIYRPEKFWIEDRVNATVAWGKLYKKELFSEIRYPEGKLHEDEWVTYKILFENSMISVIDKKLYYYFQNSEGIMKHSWSPRRLDGTKAYKEQMIYFEQNGYIDASKYTANCYADNLVYSWNQLKSYPDLRCEKRFVLKELRATLHKYGKTLDTSLIDDKFAYRIAYLSKYDVVKDYLRKKKKHIKILFQKEGVRGVWRKVATVLKKSK